MTVRHVECPVLVDCECPGMLPGPQTIPPDGYFLDPTNSIEAPLVQIGRDRFFDPSNCASAVFLPPDLDVLGIAQARRIDVIEPHREKRFPVWCKQPPMPVSCTERKITLRFNLRCISSRSGQKRHCENASTDHRLIHELPSNHLTHQKNVSIETHTKKLRQLPETTVVILRFQNGPSSLQATNCRFLFAIGESHEQTQTRHKNFYPYSFGATTHSKLLRESTIKLPCVPFGTRSLSPSLPAQGWPPTLLNPT